MVLKNEILKLHPEEVPKTFYNIAADLPVALAPPLNPATREPIGPSDLAALFPMELIRQEVSTDRFIDIPETVRDIFARFRPTPIMRATRLEKVLKTDVNIFFKYEGVSPSGSHKTNTAIPQAYYNMKEGIEKLTTETGAGQWGTALSYATSFFDMSLDVFMVRVSYEGKPYRKTMMKLLNDKTNVFSSPSQQTEYGRNVASGNPEHSGSLGVAISEAIEAAISQGAKYSLGSVLNHVLIHQSIIGQEAKIQLRNADIDPDVIIGCVGGGSNFAGLAYPFLQDRIHGRNESKFIAVESSAAPKMTQGEIRYDFGDTGKTTPLLRMHTIGSDFIPPPIHAGGLRYHGLAPTLSALIDQKLVKAEAYSQTEVFDAAKLFTQSEGIIPAPESAHAIASAIKEARNREEGTILFNLSGHGLLDLAGYDEYLQGNLRDLSASADQIKASLRNVL